MAMVTPLKKMKKMMLYPDDFFHELDDVGIKNAFYSFAVISFAAMFINFILLYFGFIPANFQGFQYVFTGGNFARVFVPALFFLGSLVIIVFYAKLVMVYAHIKKYGYRYQEVFKALSYGALPATLFAWLPVLNILFGLWSWFLEVKGISILNKVSEKQAFYSTIPAVGALVLLFIFITIFITGYFSI